MRQEGELAGTHEGEPGLPRGRSGLPAGEVREAQRERLLRAVIAAVDTAGFRNVTVADIVRGARVSRAAFYAHFADKEDCFLSATRDGARLMSSRMASAAQAVPPGAPDDQVLRAGLSGFLQFLADESAYARVLFVEMPTAGPAAVERFDAANHRIAEMNRKWHRRARTRHPEWPSVPDAAYEALPGASTELIRPIVRAGQTDSLPGLEETLMSLHMAVLAGRPWTA